jgi:molybdopterin adenylyltransferase
VSDRPLKSFRAQVVTMSDSRSSGKRRDTVGPMLTDFLRDQGAEMNDPVIVPDEMEAIVEILTGLVDDDKIDLVITTGGTGLAPRDVTPEATIRVITTEIPGLAELMRHEGGMKTIKAYLSRGVAGIRSGSLILNLPGSERGAMQSIEILMPLLPHAIETIKGESVECGSKLGEEDKHRTH